MHDQSGVVLPVAAVKEEACFRKLRTFGNRLFRHRFSAKRIRLAIQFAVEFLRLSGFSASGQDRLSSENRTAPPPIHPIDYQKVGIVGVAFARSSHRFAARLPHDHFDLSFDLASLKSD